MGARVFIALITFWVVVGLILTALGSALMHGRDPTMGIYIGAIVISIAGVVISAISQNPVVSLFGYVLITIPFGAMVGPIAAQYTEASLVNVAGTTAILTIGLGGIGVIYPKSLASWRSYLLGALLLLLVGHFSTIALRAFGLPVQGALTIFDWIAVGVFSLFMVYDMNRAMRIEHTVHNSIDCAISMYLNIINLSIHLLSGTGSKDN